MMGKMEPHRQQLGTEEFNPNLNDGPRGYFKEALRFTRHYYQDQIDSISNTVFNDVSAEFFFREAIWVIHATGFSAKAVSRFIDRLFDAYGPWNILCEEEF